MSERLVFAGTELRRNFADEHFLVVGASGSGKTELLKHLMLSALAEPSCRAIVYDPKQEVVPFLYGVRGIHLDAQGPYSDVEVLHPFDARSAAWDLAKDIDSPIAARQLATLLIPDEGEGGGKDGFFTNATRDILTGVLLAFIECAPNKGAWTLRDVLLAMLYESYQNFVFEQLTTRDDRPFPMLHRIRESYFGEKSDARTLGNIRATIAAKLAIYEPVAAAWEKARQAGRTFSLKTWLKASPDLSGQVFVLGNDEAARAAIDAINRAIFKRATEMVLAQPERSPEDRAAGKNQTWFFLDEVREAGELDGLSRLMTKGRSKNACIALGFQDIDGLRAVYGEEVSNEICAQCNNTAVMRLNSPATAEWASELFGKRLEMAQTTGRDVGADMKLTRSTADEERPFLYTEAFLYAPLASDVKFVSGFRKGPDTRVKGRKKDAVIEALEFKESELAKVPSVEQLAQGLCREHALFNPHGPELTEEQAMESLATFAPRPVSEQYLTPWEPADFERLGFKGPVPDWRGSPTERASVQDEEERQSVSDEAMTFEELKEALRRRAKGDQ